MGWLRAAFAAAAVLFGGLGVAGAAGAAPALWLVRDADSEIYLFGTLHALDPATRWRTPLYDQAYARADTVWFEAEIDKADPVRVMQIVDRYGVDRDRRLSEKLPPGELAALRRYVDPARVDHLRPWAAALMLSMRPMLGRGVTVEAGADLTMTRVARSQQKRIRAFESLEDQARLFAGLSEAAELQYLGDVLRERAEAAQFRLRRPTVSLERAWAAGQLDRLAPGLVGDMREGNPAFYEALLKRRNLAWADTIVGQLGGQGVELVNVGALHLLGADGLPALLRARGYTVTRVQ